MWNDWIENRFCFYCLQYSIYLIAPYLNYIISIAWWGMINLILIPLKKCITSSLKIQSFGSYFLCWDTIKIYRLPCWIRALQKLFRRHDLLCHFIIFKMRSHTTWSILNSQLAANNLYFEVGRNPQLCQKTHNNVCQSPFDNSWPFHSFGGGMVMGHTDTLYIK